METTKSLILKGIFGKEPLSLWDLMKTLELATLVAHSENLTRSANALIHVMTEEERLSPVTVFFEKNPYGKELKGSLDSMAGFFFGYGYTVTASLASMLIIDSATLGLNLHTKLDSISESLRIELSLRFCILLSKEEDALFHDTSPLGLVVFHEFPQYRNDISSAAQCLALGQFDASVHLIIGILEKEVREIKKFVSKSWSINPNEWGGIVDEMSKKIPNWKVPKGSVEENHKDMIERMLLNLRHVNRAYRIYSAHRKQNFLRSEAETIFRLSQSSLEEITEVKKLPLQLPVL